MWPTFMASFHFLSPITKFDKMHKPYIPADDHVSTFRSGDKYVALYRF